MLVVAKVLYNMQDYCVRGEGNLSMASKKESKLRDAINFPKSMRLACQTRIVREPAKDHRPHFID